MGDGVTVEGALEAARALSRIADALRTPREANAAITAAAARLAAARTPVGETGALAAGWHPVTIPDGVAVENRLEYAGPIIRGWPARGIEASDTIPRTDTVLEPLSVQMVESSINNSIRKEGLT